MLCGVCVRINVEVCGAGVPVVAAICASGDGSEETAQGRLEGSIRSVGDGDGQTTQRADRKPARRGRRSPRP